MFLLYYIQETYVSLASIEYSFNSNERSIFVKLLL